MWLHSRPDEELEVIEHAETAVDRQRLVENSRSLSDGHHEITWLELTRVEVLKR